MKTPEDLINRLSWQEAKTMKNIPHEYTVKTEATKAEYEELFNFILNNHYIKYFYGKPYMYYDVGEYSYWIMTDDIKISKIINRAKRKE